MVAKHVIEPKKKIDNKVATCVAVASVIFVSLLSLFCAKLAWVVL